MGNFMFGFSGIIILFNLALVALGIYIAILVIKALNIYINKNS